MGNGGIVNRTYTIGLDYGTQSARALLVRTDGLIAATAVCDYADGVIDEHLPGSRRALGADWALQNPADWLTVLEAIVPQVLAAAGVAGEQVIGIGVDFTACTILPTTADGTPLCQLPAWRETPHAWPKLWKHHAAQPQADRFNQVAVARGEAFLARYGGRVSSEWLLPKALSILEEAPSVYDAASRIIEGGDWLVWQLSGQERRNACAAGYKACWTKGEGYPSADFLAALHPRFAAVVEEKLSAEVLPAGTYAGGLTPAWAGRLGLPAGVAVGVAMIDAHAGALGMGVGTPGVLGMIMGTSTCHMLLGREAALAEGISGVVEDGIVPGLFGYEAGQAGVGDIFAWFVEHGAPAAYEDEARASGVSLHELLSARAERLPHAAGGCRPDRGDFRLQPEHEARRGLPRPDRGHGVWHAAGDRDLHEPGGAGGAPGGDRWVDQEPAADANLCRCDEPAHRSGGYRAGDRPGRGDAGRHGRGFGSRRLRQPGRCGCGHGQRARRFLSAGRRRSRGL